MRHHLAAMHARWLRIEERLATGPFETPIAVWFGFIGFIGLLSGQGVVPPTLAEALPVALVQTWTLALAFGGTMTAWGVLRDRTRTEAVGLVSLAWGVALYGSALLVAAGLAGATAAAAMYAIAFGAGIRMRVLNRDRRARALANEILRRDDDGLDE